MSRVEMHAPFKHYRGTIGDLVYRKVKGKTIVALKRDADLPIKQGEAAHRQDFTKAAEWATLAMNNDEMRQTYEEVGEKRDIPARAAAVSDYLVRPSIEPLDLSSYAGQIGNQIYFVATDNVGVTGARVTITDAAGTRYESGIPVEIDPKAGLWMYTAMSAVPAGTDALIQVQVNDRPGNIAEVTEEKAL
jgi:hypothetical protein